MSTLRRLAVVATLTVALTTGVAVGAEPVAPDERAADRSTAGATDPTRSQSPPGDSFCKVGPVPVAHEVPHTDIDLPAPCDVDSFAEYGAKWFTDAIRLVAGWMLDTMNGGYERLEDHAIGTPHPDGWLDYGKPAADDQPWRTLYMAVGSYQQGQIFVAGLLMMIVALYGRHVVNVFDFASAYRNRATKRKFWNGIVLVFAWWWIALTLLYFADGLTTLFMPDPGVLGREMQALLPEDVDPERFVLINPVTLVVMTLVGVLGFILLEAMFIVRDLIIYMYVFVGPLGIAFAFSGIPMLEDYARSILKRYFPLVMMPIPTALAFHAYYFALTTDALPDSLFAKYLLYCSLPLVGVYVTWKGFTLASPLVARASRTAANAGAGVATAGSVVAARSATAGAAYAKGQKALSASIARSGVKRGVLREYERRARRRDDGDGESEESNDPGERDDADAVSAGSPPGKTDAPSLPESSPPALPGRTADPGGDDGRLDDFRRSVREKYRSFSDSASDTRDALGGASD